MYPIETKKEELREKFGNESNQQVSPNNTVYFNLIKILGKKSIVCSFLNAPHYNHNMFMNNFASFIC